MLRSGYCPLEKNVEKLYKKTGRGQSREILLVDGNTEASQQDSRARTEGREWGGGTLSYLQLSKSYLLMTKNQA